MDDSISVHNRFESMDCSHEADSSDSEVFVSPATVAALQAQIIFLAQFYSTYYIYDR